MPLDDTQPALGDRASGRGQDVRVRAADHYEYCELFVQTADRSAVVALVGRLPGAAVDGDRVEVAGMTWDVRRHSDWDASEAGSWLLWPTIVDVQSRPARPHAVVELVSEFLRASWAARIGVVAACKFEDELPWSGGIELVRDGPFA